MRINRRLGKLGKWKRPNTNKSGHNMLILLHQSINTWQIRRKSDLKLKIEGNFRTDMPSLIVIVCLI